MKDFLLASSLQNPDFQVEEDLKVESFAEMEISVKRLLEILKDDKDHPEIWNIFKLSAESNGRDSLIALANYINDLLDVAQPPHVVQILTVAHAVCAAYLGNSLFACKKLQELMVHYSGSQLVQGAFMRVKVLES